MGEHAAKYEKDNTSLSPNIDVSLVDAEGNKSLTTGWWSTEGAIPESIVRHVLDEDFVLVLQFDDNSGYFLEKSLGQEGDEQYISTYYQMEKGAPYINEKAPRKEAFTKQHRLDLEKILSKGVNSKMPVSERTIHAILLCPKRTKDATGIRPVTTLMRQLQGSIHTYYAHKAYLAKFH